MKKCIFLGLVDMTLDMQGICATEEAGGVWAGHPMLPEVSLAYYEYNLSQPCCNVKY